MKKIFCVIISVLCLSGGFCVSVTASPVRTENVAAATESYEINEVPVEFSSDFKSLSYNGIDYVLFNDDTLVSYNSGEETTAILTAKQKETVSKITFIDYENKDVLNATFSLNIGGTLELSYLKKSLLEEYNKALTNDWQIANIDFVWPSDNYIQAKKSDLKIKPVKFIYDSYDIRETFTVYTPINGKQFGVIKGELVAQGDKYYYIDFADADITYGQGYHIGLYNRIDAYEITDGKLLVDIKAAMENYYGSDYGFFEDDKFTSTVSDVFLTVLFCIIPFAILVLAIIFTFRSKQKYKKYFATISILALAELVVFVITVILFTVLK